MTEVPFVVGSLVLVAAAQFVGGPSWAVLSAIAVAFQSLTDRGSGRLVLVAVSLTWMALSRLADRRDFFFPFTMFLASVVFAQLADRNFWWGVCGGFAVLAAFFAVRIQQGAANRVLFVEFVVASAIQEFSMIAHGVARRRAISRMMICAGASLLACLSLVL